LCESGTAQSTFLISFKQSFLNTARKNRWIMSIVAHGLDVADHFLSMTQIMPESDAFIS
jgi:hypothetical protein